MASSNEFSNKEINKLRTQYIKKMIKPKVEGKQVLKYIGPIDVVDIPDEILKDLKARIKGIEKFIEYHLFEVIDCETPVIYQWRCI